MTVVTLRPDATDSAGTVTGAPTAHQALADDSDSSYVDLTVVQAWTSGGGGLGNLTVPAGAVIKRAAIRVRCAHTGTPGQVAVTHDMGAGRSVGDTLVVSWSTPTTVVFDTRSYYPYLTEAEIDAGGSVIYSISATLRAYALYFDVTYVEKPELTVDAPTGTVDDTNQPVVSWTPDLDTDGGTQQYYWVKVFTDAQYGAGGFDPATSTPLINTGGVFGTATSWQVTEPLPDDTYRAYVSVYQVVNGALHASAWEHAEFDVEVETPPSPTLVLTTDSTNARITIDVDPVAPGVGEATSDYLELQRSLDGGATWDTVRQLVAGLFESGSVTVYDYECDNGVETHYRARALHDYSGQLAASAWATDEATWASSEWWLKHPHRPDLNMPVVVRAFPSLQRTSRQGVFQALGSSSPIVVSDTRGPKTGQVTLRAYTLDDQAALDALLDTNAVLLLQSPPAKGGPGYVVVGNHDRQRIFETDDASRVWEVLDITVVDSPPGDIVAWPA